MRLVFACFLFLLLISCLTLADTTDVQPLRPSPVRDFLAEHLQFPSFQLSLFSYKPELGSLSDILPKCRRIADSRRALTNVFGCI